MRVNTQGLPHPVRLGHSGKRGELTLEEIGALVFLPHSAFPKVARAPGKDQQPRENQFIPPQGCQLPALGAAKRFGPSADSGRDLFQDLIVDPLRRFALSDLSWGFLAQFPHQLSDPTKILSCQGRVSVLLHRGMEALQPTLEAACFDMTGVLTPTQELLEQIAS
jgi:hypothetical protein